MFNSLLKAQELAEKIRFSGDQLRPHSEGDPSIANTVRSQFYENGLQITREVTPQLHLSLSRVCNKLKIPSDCLEAFVYASPDLQAECYSGGLADCTLRFTSSLITLLETDELDFVIGHELGHFLLHHSVSRMENESESLEYYIQQRSQEISADRLGLISCGSLDVAIRTLIKTISGLDNQHLRLDIGTFISQLQKTKHQTHVAATHPSIIVRSRALLWFSLGNTYQSNDLNFKPGELDTLDKKILQDLDKYVDRSAKARMKEAKTNLHMWMAAYKVVEDGRFDKHEQESFKAIFGEETFNKFLNYLSGLSESEVLQEIHRKVDASLKELESLMPSSFKKEVEIIEKQLATNFK